MPAPPKVLLRKASSSSRPSQPEVGPSLGLFDILARRYQAAGKYNLKPAPAPARKGPPKNSGSALRQGHPTLWSNGALREAIIGYERLSDPLRACRWTGWGSGPVFQQILAERIRPLRGLR
jgi:hypothetical protein